MRTCEYFKEYVWLIDGIFDHEFVLYNEEIKIEGNEDCSKVWFTSLGGIWSYSGEYSTDNGGSIVGTTTDGINTFKFQLLATVKPQQGDRFRVLCTIASGGTTDAGSWTANDG